MSRPVPTNNRGLSVVELIVASAIILIIFVALIASTNLYYSSAFTTLRDVEATYITEEGMEIVRYLKDQNWSKIGQLSTTTTYYLIWTGTDYATTTVPTYTSDFFLRRVTVADVKRDGNSDIATVGTYDPETKRITVTTTYVREQATTTKTLEGIVT